MYLNKIFFIKLVEIPRILKFINIKPKEVYMIELQVHNEIKIVKEENNEYC